MKFKRGNSAGRELELGRLSIFVIRCRMAVRATNAAGLGAGAERFVDDGFDGPRAAAAFGAATETAIDLLGVPHCIAGLSDGGANIVVADKVAGTDDHGKLPALR